MSLNNDNSNNRNVIISLDPRFFISAPEPDDIQNIDKNFEGIKDEENYLEEINGLENVNQNAFDIFKERQRKKDEVTKKNGSKKEIYLDKKIPKLKNKAKKRRKLSSLEGNGRHKSNSTEKKILPNKKKIIFLICKDKNTNNKSSSISKEFLRKKTKRKANHESSPEF